MAGDWTPKLTRGLWGYTQRAVREGLSLRDALGAVQARGERPDAATFSRLYARAVEGESRRAREADYRTRVSEDLYRDRRPGGQQIATLPYALPGRYRQVVRITGQSILTRQPVERWVNVDTPRLVSRGEAIDAALALLGETPKGILMDVTGVEYVGTWAGQ